MPRKANIRKRQNQSRKLSLLFLRLAVILILCASTSLAERLPVKTYTVADGLLRDNIFKIKQDSRGFLWFCTVEGISRFDGYEFTNFTTGDGLPNRYVNDFLETRDGTIWIATNGGLARLNPTGTRPQISDSKPQIPKQNASLFTTLLPDNPRAKEINVLFEDESGAVFAGTGDGLYKLNERGKLELINLGKPLPNLDALPISLIIKDRRGAMWIGTDAGLYRLLPNGEIEQFTKENGLPDTNISTLHEDRNGRIWVGLRPSYAAGLVLLVAEPQKNQLIVERHFREKEGLPADWITDLFETSDGKFWVATIRGLCQWEGGENSVCKTYTSVNDLCDTEIWSLAEDKDKNLWAGTRCGLKKLKRYGFTTYTEADGLNTLNANSIFENAAGELFISFIHDKNIRTVSRFDSEKFELVKPSFPQHVTYSGWGSRQTVWQTSAGDWWFPTGFGLYRFSQPARFEDLAKIAPRKIQFGAERKEIFRFFEDSRGDFWIATTGTANELWHWERAANEWHNLTQELGFGKRRLGLSFVEDRAENLWIGAGGDEADTALIRYRNGHFQIFSKTENELLAGWLNNLFVDGKGRLWITSTVSGLLRLDDVNAEQLNFTRYTPAEGLSSIGVTCVTEDEFGRIYVGTGRGLDRLNPETGQVENFTTADGLPNSFVEIAYRDRKNNLWFGTANGLARFIPEPPLTRQPPNIFITGLRVEGEPQSVSILGASEIPPLELDSDKRQIAVDFLGLGANLGERLKYEYRFGDSDWTVTTERTVNFTNLAPGEYRFEVRAQTADRILSSPASISFRIATPFYLRWWFLLAAVLLVGGLVYLLYRYRVARLLEMERMRTRIATDLHDDIGANLTRIALLSEVANQQMKSNGGSGNLLPSIADIARESVASMNDIVWAISPEHDRLLDLTRRMRRHAEEIFTVRDIDLEFSAPPADCDIQLSVGVRRDLLLIFKEAVNNAAKHSDCTKVLIDFRCQDAIVRLSVKDDGKGFETDSDSEGQGLQSMKRRADALGGDYQIDSREGAGTSVEFEMSLPKTRSASRF